VPAPRVSRRASTGALASGPRASRSPARSQPSRASQSQQAPRRRTHSAHRHQSRGFSRDPATSNRHRRPVTGVRTGPKPSKCS
jgi:hypothetical protein